MKEKIAAGLPSTTEGDLNRQTKIRAVAEVWIREIEQRQDHALQTIEVYRDIVNRIILPGVGDLRLGELTVGILGRVGSYFDNAAAEAFSSSLEWEVLSHHEFATTGQAQAQAVVLDWCYGYYNQHRRHSAAGMMSPINYENTAAPDRESAQRSPPRFGGNHREPSTPLIVPKEVAQSAYIGRLRAR